MSSSSFNSLGLLIACFLLTVRCSLAQDPPMFSRRGTSNSITVLCSSNTFLFYSVNAEYQFQANSDNGLYTFSITPENETAVACTDSSPRLVFAAFPMVNSMSKIEMLARIGETQPLKCPYDLGVARTVLNPYHHVWLTNGVTISNQTSQTLRTYTTKDSPEEYSCAIRMVGCNSTCSVVTVPDQIDQVKFMITKVEPISIITSPDNQNITEGNEAVFNCSANGTSIEIIWNYNGANYTESNQDVGISIVVNNHTNFVRSVLTIGDVKANGTVSCIVHQAFDGRLSSINNLNFSNNLQDDYYFSESAFLIVELSPRTTTTTTPDSSSTAATTMEGPSPPSTVEIIIACLAIVIVVATTFVISLVIFLYCHYHYKYKRNSSKLGRFLSRAMSKPPKTHAVSYQNNLPADSNGHVLPICFQSSYSVNHPPTDSGLAQSSIRNGAQEQEQIYNTSQYSGGSYSGLSGVSNQEPGAQHNMPQYCATDVSGGSGNPQTSITSGGRLAPPYHHGNGIGRSQRLSDASEHSQQSSHGSHPIKLTHEALIQHQHRASSYNSIPNAPQAHSAFVHGTKLPPTTQTDNQYHSDTHLMTARPHNSLFQAKLPSPALATVETDHFPQAFAPFPHNEPEPTQAPFPNEDSNRDTRVSEKTIEEVLDSLMHNRNCRIPNCMCHSARKLYISKMTHKQRPGTLQCQQSSSSSDSDSAIDKRSKLYLPLSSQDISSLHPHFHPGAKMRVRSSNPRSKLCRRRSKSLDLTPVGECPEVSPTNTPKVGGSLVPGTPLYAPPSLQGVIPNENRFSLGEGEKPTLSQSYFYPPTQNSPSPCTPESNLNKLNSLSADNLPTLCLNDCPLSSTPRGEIKALNQLQINHQTAATAGKPALSTINEKNKEADTDGSNTSSRSDSPPNFTKTTQSNQGIHGSKAVKRDLVMSHEDSIGWNSITKDVVDRELSQGYQSETLSSLSISSLKPASRRSYSKPTGSDHSQRSASPAYETYVVVSDDGSTVQTTEC